MYKPYCWKLGYLIAVQNELWWFEWKVNSHKFHCQLFFYLNCFETLLCRLHVKSGIFGSGISKDVTHLQLLKSRHTWHIQKMFNDGCFFFVLMQKIRGWVGEGFNLKLLHSILQFTFNFSQWKWKIMFLLTLSSTVVVPTKTKVHHDNKISTKNYVCRLKF